MPFFKDYLTYIINRYIVRKNNKIKKETLSKVLAYSFLIAITVLSRNYLQVNKFSLQPGYFSLLLLCIPLTLIFFIVIELTATEKKISEATKLAYAEMLFWLLTSSYVKSTHTRQEPNTPPIIDFKYWPTFNELWEPYQRFFWHFGLDMIVFMTILALSTSHKWFPKLLQILNVSKKA